MLNNALINSLQNPIHNQLTQPPTGNPMFSPEMIKQILPSIMPEIQPYLQKMVNDALIQSGAVAAPFDIAKFGNDVLIESGNAMGSEKATWFKDNLNTFVPFLKSKEGIDIVNLVIDEYKGWKGVK